MSVNISPRQLIDDALPGIVAGALAESGIAPGCLWLELTESILVKDSYITRNALNQIRSTGVRLALDDFGIGFSSLAYLTRFSVDGIKVDRSLLRNCTTDSNSLAVFRAVVAMAHSLKLRVVAEGVETKEQLSLLRSEGCDTAQGYFLNQPMSLDALPSFIDSFGSTRSDEQTSTMQNERNLLNSPPSYRNDVAGSLDPLTPAPA